MARREHDPIDPATSRQIGNFLFERPTKEDDGKPNLLDSQYLDIRTDITTKQTMKLLLGLRVSQHYFPTPKGAPGLVANTIERLAISAHRGGRTEAVEILRRQMPKVQEIEVGTETRYNPTD